MPAADFEIDDRPVRAAIRFGLAAIKNAGVGPWAVLDAGARRQVC
jgi:hypothetical protein